MTVIPHEFHTLVSAYLRLEVSTTDMARLLGVAKSTVLRWMSISGVQRHKPGAMISVKMTGKPSSRLGATHTPEAKAKQSAARTGKPTTLGFRFSEESKQKMREARAAYYARIGFVRKSPPPKTPRVKKDKPSAAQKREKLTLEEVLARRKARNACKRLLRRVLTMARVRKDASTEKLLGYTKCELRAHLESQFREGMGWGVRDSFHIDHIKPVAQFFREGIFDPAKINALDNLQVLTPEENRAKRDTYEVLV